jgi:hypothetical protein
MSSIDKLLVMLSRFSLGSQSDVTILWMWDGQDLLI